MNLRFGIQSGSSRRNHPSSADIASTTIQSGQLDRAEAEEVEDVLPYFSLTTSISAPTLNPLPHLRNQNHLTTSFQIDKTQSSNPSHSNVGFDQPSSSSNPAITHARSRRTFQTLHPASNEEWGSLDIFCLSMEPFGCRSCFNPSTLVHRDSEKSWSRFSQGRQSFEDPSSCHFPADWL